MSAALSASAPQITESPAASFMLANGMQVVVVSDRRTPVVTHMVWYKNGAADDPPGKSGIAHFLEHLMFKGTEKHPKGAFSKLVSDLGGQENAFTSYDYTAYFQRIAREHLGEVMALEADRMSNLVLSDDEVNPERDVVLEERRMGPDSNPSSQLWENVNASLYLHHPYGTPVIGWKHEIEGLSREDALGYYRRFYTPANAILVVAGDTDAAEVRRLAEDTYGRVAAAEPPRRLRPQEPPSRSGRKVEVSDPKVEQPTLQRAWVVPSERTATGNEAYALTVLSHLLGGGQASRLHRTLVTEKAMATSVGSYYWGDFLDATRLGLYGVPREGVSLPELEKAMDEVVATLIAEGISERELARARTRLVADMVYARDSQMTMAQMYGSVLATGGSLTDVDAWPQRIEAVTAGDVVAVAARYLQPRIAVTGYLTKAAA
jgi:zinc protease